MAKRTHSQNTLLLGSQSGICDDCGFQFKQIDLRKKWDGLVVCRDCWEPQHPSDLYDYRSRDNGGGAGSSTRPDDDGTASGTSVDGSPIPPAINITTTDLGEMSLGSAFSITLETDIVPVGPTWSVESGALPTGLSLDASTGVISGIPTASGDYSLVIKIVQSGSTATDTQAYTGTLGFGSPCTWETNPIDSPAVGAGAGNIWTGPSFPDGSALTIEGTTSNAVAKYLNPETGTWNTTATSPGNGLYSMGCVMSTGEFLFINYSRVVKTYNRDTDTWTDRDTMPGTSTNYFSDMASYNGYTYVFGGTNQSTTIRVFDETTYQWTTSATAFPNACCGHVVCSLGDGRILVGGGQNSYPVASGGQVYEYYFFDTTTHLLTQTTSIPTDMWKAYPGVVGLLTDGTVYVGGGGSNYTSATTYTSVFDPVTETWDTGCSVLPVAASRGNSSSRKGWIDPDGRVRICPYNTGNNYKSVTPQEK